MLDVDHPSSACGTGSAPAKLLRSDTTSCGGLGRPPEPSGRYCTGVIVAGPTSPAHVRRPSTQGGTAALRTHPVLRTRYIGSDGHGRARLMDRNIATRLPQHQTGHGHGCMAQALGECRRRGHPRHQPGLGQWSHSRPARDRARGVPHRPHERRRLRAHPPAAGALHAP